MGCHRCSIKEDSTWRKGLVSLADGTCEYKAFCNACGLNRNQHGVERPGELFCDRDAGGTAKGGAAAGQARKQAHAAPGAAAAQAVAPARQRTWARHVKRKAAEYEYDGFGEDEEEPLFKSPAGANSAAAGSAAAARRAAAASSTPNSKRRRVPPAGLVGEYELEGPVGAGIKRAHEAHVAEAEGMISSQEVDEELEELRRQEAAEVLEVMKACQPASLPPSLRGNHSRKAQARRASVGS